MLVILTKDHALSIRTIYAAAALCGLLSSLSTAPAHADSVAAVKKTLQTLYNQSAAAFVRKDADGVYDMYDPDCTVYSTKGEQVSLVDLRDVTGKLLNIFQKMTETEHIKSMTLGNTDGTQNAKVLLSYVMHAVIFTPQGKRITTSDVMVRRDYWEKTDDGWKIKQSRILSDVTSLNGKHVDMSDVDSGSDSE